MKYTVDKQEKYTLLEVIEDKLDSIVAPAFKTELTNFNAEGSRNIILSLKDVKYVDSSGLSAILLGNRLCESVGGTMILSNINSHVDKLVKISQLDKVLNILPTTEEAVEAVFLHELESELKQEGGVE